MTKPVRPATNADGALETVRVYVGASESPITGGRWEVLADDTVRYVRPNGRIEQPAIVSASTLRTSPTWHRLP